MPLKAYIPIILTMCATHSLAIAQVNKCTQPDGTIIFSDKPCQNSKRLPRIKPQLGRSTQPMDERAAAEQRSLDKWKAEMNAQSESLAAEKEREREKVSKEGTLTASPKSTTSPMSFEHCNATVASTIRSLNRRPQDIRYIIRSTIMTTTRICTADGSVLITCSRPDEKMITTVSDRSVGVGCN